MQVFFDVTEKTVNEMSAEDYEAFERAQDGDFKLYRLRPALCRFMVNEDHTPVPYEQAVKISGKMKIGEVKDFVRQFFDVMKRSAIPNGNGSPSKSPSEVERADSLSQAG